MPIQTTTIKTPDGRDLCIESFGDPSDPAIVFLSGTYQGRTLYPGMIKASSERGFFVLGYDRPGYGGSTPQPGRVISNCAEDLVAIADHFGLNQLLTLGFSGGGSHSVAAAVLLPDLVAASVAICPIQPIEVAQADSHRDALRDYAEKERNEVLATDHDAMIKGNMNFPAKQRVSLDFLEFHYASMKAALEPGIEGCFEDLAAYYTPWGVDLTTNKVPIKIWHGRADVTVAYTHSEWLAANTPHVQLHLTNDDSHRSIFENSFEAASQWLLGHK